MSSKSKNKNKKTILKNVSIVDTSCNNFFSIFTNIFSNKKPKTKPNIYTHFPSSSSTPLTTTAAAAVAVEKDSDDPYLDFRQSMLQMILENKIYSKNELRELLDCFLSLNSEYHHGVILRAFSEIWQDVSSAVETSSPLVSQSRASRDYYYSYY
ncbi:unnamed protein product [Cochlearia groenlandica]